MVRREGPRFGELVQDPDTVVCGKGELACSVSQGQTSVKCPFDMWLCPPLLHYIYRVHFGVLLLEVEASVGF